MKKSKIILFGATFLVTLGMSFTTPTQATASNRDVTTTTQSNSDVPESVQNAVDDLFDNYLTDETIDIDDASISHPTEETTEGTHYNFNEFSKIPLIKKYLLKSGFSTEEQLNNVKFSYYVHHSDDNGDFDYTYWTQVYAYYDGNLIGSKRVEIKYLSSSEEPTSFYSNPTDLVGQVTATNQEGKQYAPLIDTVNKESNRSLAPKSDWYTDKFMVDKNWGDLFYRVSTSEWVNERYIKPHANTSLKISDLISNSGNKIYQVTDRRVSGQPLYKSNGELWDYTLPDGSKWKVTAIGFDQYGSIYGEVSTDAWIRMNHALK
ncbi:hypothetical protein [Companilactobacillus furfuricola]|uniref:hypothetical protein n=1 Tax=Companilactobacillus furfuricola TaxID=1462575 RepID=UPI000F780907|nr:hypothetical protein [Companilactobacillus furfuricola]